VKVVNKWYRIEYKTLFGSKHADIYAYSQKSASDNFYLKFGDKEILSICLILKLS
jgi:hypothetical protein